MNRRQAFGAALAGAVAAVAAAVPAAAGPEIVLRPVFRRVGDEWVRCRMFEVLPGELVRVVLEDGTTDEGIVRTRPEKMGRHWGVMIDDPPCAG